MNRRWGTLIVAMGIVLLAGCSGTLSGEGDAPTPTVSTTEPPTETATPTTTPTATPDPVDPDNPFGKETLVVGLSNESSRDVNRTEELLSSLAYWEENADEYAGYSVSFEFDADAANPDFEIVLVDSIPMCGRTYDPEVVTLGCAPIPKGSADLPMEIEVLNDFSAVSTQKIMKHELGHALGIEHGDDPMPLMANSTTAYPEQLDYTYTVEEETNRHQGWAINEQLSGAEQFLESGGGGTIGSDISIQEVDSESDADLTVVITDDDGACAGNRVSCIEGSWDCLESGTCRGAEQGVTLTLERIKTDAIGWFVARQLFIAIDNEQGAIALPDEFDLDKTDPTKTWWN